MKPTPQLAAAEFAQIAKGFCEWCEGSEFSVPADVTASVWLARLHSAALALPEVDSQSEDGLPPIPEAIAARARLNLAAFDGFYYREYFNPAPSLTDASGIGDVGDDLADTYKDVRAGLLLYESGQPVEALWHWSFLHRVHWGRHVVGALFALQCARSFSEE